MRLIPCLYFRGINSVRMVDRRIWDCLLLMLVLRSNDEQIPVQVVLGLAGYLPVSAKAEQVRYSRATRNHVP